jgi:hypothetical protein
MCKPNPEYVPLAVVSRMQEPVLDSDDEDEDGELGPAVGWVREAEDESEVRVGPVILASMRAEVASTLRRLAKLKVDRQGTLRCPLCPFRGFAHRSGAHQRPGLHMRVRSCVCSRVHESQSPMRPAHPWSTVQILRRAAMVSPLTWRPYTALPSSSRYPAPFSLPPREHIPAVTTRPVPSLHGGCWRCDHHPT